MNCCWVFAQATHSPNSWRYLSALLGGMISGVPCANMELVMTQQMNFGTSITATLRPYASEQLCLDYAGAFADAGCRNIETLALLDPCYIEPILTMAHISSGGSDHGVPKLHLSVIRKELSKLQRMRWLCAP